MIDDAPPVAVGSLVPEVIPASLGVEPVLGAEPAPSAEHAPAGPGARRAGLVSLALRWAAEQPALRWAARQPALRWVARQPALRRVGHRLALRRAGQPLAVWMGVGLALATGLAWWGLTSGDGSLSPAQMRQALAAAGAAGAAVMHAAPGSSQPTSPTAPATAAPPTTGGTAPSSAVPAPTAPPPTTGGTAPSSAASAPDASSPGPGSGTPGGAPASGSALVPPEVSLVATELVDALDQQSDGRLHIPLTSDNVALLVQWMANEGGLWADNPLNTSLDSGQYPHQYTDAGVDTGIPIFPSMHDGVVATATTLLQNPAYGRILSLLEAGTTSCPVFAAAVIRSPWASSHYGYDPGAFCGAAPSGAIGPGRRGRHPGGSDAGGSHHGGGVVRVRQGTAGHLGGRPGRR